MRVKCNQCGKMFEVPSTQTNRALKCICKNIFIAEPMLEEIPADGTKTAAKDEGPWSDNIKEDTKKFIQRYGAEEQGADESTVTSASSDIMIDEHISLLKKQRESIQPKNDSTAVVPPIARQELELSLDLDIPEPADELDDLPDNSIEGIESLDVDMSSARKEAAAPAEAELKAESNLLSRKASSQDRISDSQYRRISQASSASTPEKKKIPMKWVGGASFALVMLIAIFGIRNSSNHRPKIEPAATKDSGDPYLTKLISQSSKNAKVVIIENENPPPQPAEKIPERPAAKAPEPSPIARSTPGKKEKSEDLLAMLHAYVRGNFQEVIRLFQSASKPTSDMKALHFEALLHRAGEDQTRIRQILTRITDELKQNPEAPDLLRAKAFAMLEIADDLTSLQDAHGILKSLSQTQAYDPLVFAYLGMTYARMSEISQTRAPWDRALALEPNLLWLLDLERDFYFSIGQPEEAVRSALKLVEKAGQEARGYRLAGEIRVKQERYADAMILLDRSLSFAEDPAVRILAAQILESSNPILALKHIEKVLGRASTLKVDQLTEAKHLAARLYCNQGDSEKGKSIYTSLLNEQVTKRLLVDKGECEIKGGLLVSASETYERALKLDVRDPQLWLRYSQLLLKRGKAPAAAEASLKSLKLKESEAAHAATARALLAQHKADLAKTHIRRALQLNPKNAEALQLRKQLN